MKKRTLASVLGIAMAATLALAACAPGGTPSSESGDDMTVSVGRLGIGSDAAMSLAQQNGTYAAQGLTVEDQIVANPPAALAAVQSGQLDVAYTTVMAFFQARSQGVDLQAIASADGIGVAPEGSTDLAPLDLSGLFVNPESGITSEAQLSGKTVAVLARNGSLEMAIAAAVDREGGDSSTINWVALDFASAVEALRGGTIDAAGLVTPFTNQALSAGMVQLGAPVAELFGQGAVTAIWVSTPTTIAAKGPAIDAFIRAQHDAAVYANEHIDESMAEAKAITGIDLPVEELTRIYWIPTLNPEELTQQMELTYEHGYLPQPLDMADAAYQPSA